MKLNFDELKENFTYLNLEELLEISAGQGIPLSNEDLQRLFDYNSMGGFNSDLAKFFNLEINKLASTDVGSAALQGLLNDAKSPHGKPIQLSTKDDPALVQAMAFYRWDSAAGSSINIKRFDTFNINDPVDVEVAFHTLSHEIFHAYEAIVIGIRGKADPRSFEVSREIDANLFAGFAEKQIDKIEGKDEYYRMGSNIYISNDPNVPANEHTFEEAWRSIFDKNDFSVENYNHLVDTFKDSRFNMRPTGQTSPYDNLNTNHPTVLDGKNSAIYHLFDGYFKATNEIKKDNPDTGNNVPSYDGGTSTGGTVGSYSDGSTGNNGSFEWIYSADPSDPSGGQIEYHDLPTQTWFDKDGNYHPEWGTEPEDPRRRSYN